MGLNFIAASLAALKGSTGRIDYPNNDPNAEIEFEAHGIPSMDKAVLIVGETQKNDMIAYGRNVSDSVYWDEANKTMVYVRDDPTLGDGYLVKTTRKLIDDKTIRVEFLATNKKTNKTAILKMAQGNMPKHQIPGSLTKVTDKSELLMSSSSSISSNNNSSSTKVDPVVENTMKSNSTVQYYIATQPVFTLNNNNQSEQMAMIVHRNEIPSPNIKPITSFNQLHVFCFAYNPVRDILYMGTQSGVMFMDLSMKKPYSQKLGTLNATINCLAFDTRDYSRLYCGHNDAASNFVSWYDGNDWQTLDQGLNAPCLTMIFDSTGKTLFMGGKFTEINGFRLKSRYVCGYHVESKRWVQIGNCGLDNTCKTLAFDSACRRLYIGGDFTSFVDRMGISQPCDYILVYDMNNSNWIPYGTEALFTGVNGPVNCMAFDTVRGRLYVGGAFFESASSTTAVVTSLSLIHI